jgi:hypothetical protein
MSAKCKTKFFVGLTQRARRIRENIDEDMAMYDNNIENIPNRFNVTSDEDEESISDPELNVTSVEDGENTLPIDSVNFMGAVRDNLDLARETHFDDQSIT